MIEKLLENWLDRASERSYQAVFVQMLAADGYRILHSTRHCLLEFGKDILAIAPDGVGCAFQLKGDPQGRMTVGEFRREIQQQLVQLMGQAPAYPGFPPGPHRSYLVSNGQFEEEVQAATREMNMAPYPSKVELWSRGHLFDLCKKHGALLWPSELAENRALLEMYLANQKDRLPVDTLNAMLNSVLSLSENLPTFKRPDLIRSASSATWLTGIATSTFAEAENHYAVAMGWTLCCISLVAAAEKHAAGNISTVQPSLQLAQDALLDSLAALWEEARGRKYLLEGNAMTDPEVFGWRIGILYGLLSTLAIADAELALLDQVSREALHHWLKENGHSPELWGEGAIANIVPWLIWLRKNDPTMRPDAEIAAAARAVIDTNQYNASNPLAAPYYDVEPVLRWRLQVPGAEQAMNGESFDGSAFTAEALLHLVVRTNMKRTAKGLWPNFSKLGHRGLSFAAAWHFCLLKVSEGVDETRLYPSTYQWQQLKSDMVSATTRTALPSYLAATPWLLAMWWQVAPHRVTTQSVGVFAEALLPDWGHKS